MKRISTLILLAIVAISSSCSKRVETVSDQELALIFRDAFLANAYVYEAKLELDSLQLYQPIFDKYGYSVADVAYTVGSFSKRKSARLSDVVEQAIKLLETQAKVYSSEVVILDSIEMTAQREAARDIYFDPLVEFHAIKDSTKLEIIIDSLQPGRYQISFNYNIDSIDNNRSRYRTMTWVQPTGTKSKKGLTSTYLRKGGDEVFNKTLTFDTITRNLHLRLADTYEVKRKPHVTFQNIKIKHTPTSDVAIEEYFRKKLDIRIFADDFFTFIQAADSLKLPAL